MKRMPLAFILLIGSLIASTLLAYQAAEVINNKDGGSITLITEDLEITCASQEKIFQDHEKVLIDFAKATKEDGDDTLTESYRFEINHKSATILRLHFIHKPKNTWVAHGPGDVAPFSPCINCLMISGDIGNKALFLNVQTVNNDDALVIAGLKRNDNILIEFREDDPYHVYIIGMKMNLTIFELFDKEDAGN